MRTVRQVARAAGVSVRTLHHYDALGLLVPAHVGDNGYRYYGRAELLRLQQILFYRELGLPLARIGAVLDDPEFDTLAALRGHRVALAERVERYRDLILTIDRTIDSLERDEMMDDQDLYAGIAPETKARWNREARERWGDGAVDAAAKRLATDPAPSTLKDEMAANRRAFATLAGKGADPASAEAQDVARAHYRWVCRSWTPDAGAFAALGRMMVDDPGFRATYNEGPEGAPGTAAFMAEAMRVFAEREL
ncbi:DNA-binding transcriptional MerR regulator [Sphingomonas jinjuensis]|uniref:DNA-binding transcriptional MerR regulator n=1 Tax=Sphingomonas jinjuensis TaxID=535907 RepID=A0A840F174_9SPHN|nr:MerR family transcriptional regulator [Sphingomonas jinjuensis]MBB4153073.1 DNA-binding transcriptional MerR regulator [Sphingomonas jinjuensis]